MTLTEQIARALCRQKAEVTSSGLMVGEFLDRWVDEHWQIEVTNAEMILPFIAAERERCALIAEQPILYDYVHCATPEGLSEPGSPYDRGRQFQAKRIAADIRNQQ